MDATEFNNIYIEKILCEIKECLDINGIRVDDANSKSLRGGRIIQIDKKMKLVLKDILLHSTMLDGGETTDDLNYNYLKFYDCSEFEARKKFKCSLILYYTALYFDSLDLLNSFFRERFEFGDDPKRLSLCFLDSSMFSYFKDFEFYIKIIKRYRSAFENFYKSIKDVEGSERKAYFNKFSTIIKKREDIPAYALTKNKLNIIEEETYMAASTTQLEDVIGSMHLKNPDNIARINRLIRTTDYSAYFGYYTDNLLAVLDDEELFKLSRIGCHYYLARGLEYGVDIHRLLRLYEANPLISNYSFTLNPYFLEVFSDSDIARMSEDFLVKLCIDQDELFPQEFTEKNYR